MNNTLMIIFSAIWFISLLAIFVSLIASVIFSCLHRSVRHWWVSWIVTGGLIFISVLSFILGVAFACDHEYELVDEKLATCTDAGYRSYRCPKCGYEKTDDIAALGHDMRIVSRTEPTETDEGEIVRCCERCGFEESERLDKLTQGESGSDKTDGFVSGEPLGGDDPADIVDDGIVAKLVSFGFTEDEAKDVREIFIKCGLNNIDNAEPTDPNAVIDGLASYRIVIDDDRTAWFTVDHRKVFYIALNGVDVYDADQGGYLININDVHVPESEVTPTVAETLRQYAESKLDGYFIDADYYDGWGYARQDDKYMVQCQAYASNRLGSKKWVFCKVWFERDGDEYNIVGVVIDGVRYE